MPSADAIGLAIQYATKMRRMNIARKLTELAQTKAKQEEEEEDEDEEIVAMECDNELSEEEQSEEEVEEEEEEKTRKITEKSLLFQG